MACGRRSRIKLCKEEGCHNASTTGGFCRFHYLRNWKRIKEKQQKAAAERLNKYVDRMTKRFPGRFVDEIKKDLRTRQFEQNVQGEYGEPDDLAHIFSDVEYAEEVDRVLHDLKIEKEF